MRKKGIFKTALFHIILLGAPTMYACNTNNSKDVLKKNLQVLYTSCAHVLEAMQTDNQHPNYQKQLQETLVQLTQVIDTLDTNESPEQIETILSLITNTGKLIENIYTITINTNKNQFFLDTP